LEDTFCDDGADGDCVVVVNYVNWRAAGMLYAVTGGWCGGVRRTCSWYCAGSPGLQASEKSDHPW